MKHPKELHWLRCNFIMARANTVDDELERIMQLERDVCKMLKDHPNLEYPIDSSLTESLNIYASPDVIEE